MAGARRGLRTKQESGTDLRSGSAQDKCRLHPAGVGNTPGCNNRNLDSADNLREQGESTHLCVDIVAEKHSTMPASLQALGDDAIGTTGFQP